MVVHPTTLSVCDIMMLSEMIAHLENMSFGQKWNLPKFLMDVVNEIPTTPHLNQSNRISLPHVHRSGIAIWLPA